MRGVEGEGGGREDGRKCMAKGVEEADRTGRVRGREERERDGRREGRTDGRREGEREGRRGNRQDGEEARGGSEGARRAVSERAGPGQDEVDVGGARRMNFRVREDEGRERKSAHGDYPWLAVAR